MKPKVIALLTDFGNDDPYVGIMKGVISDLAPGTQTIDITHQVPSGDIQRGAFVLWQTANDFLKDTIFLCVIDPGVGSDRKGLILQKNGKIFIGPDNGLFTYILYNSQFSCWELSNPQYQKEAASATFHGRDVFAPAAAYAARYISGNQFGNKISDLCCLRTPILNFEEKSLNGEILSHDHFGNLFTSIGRLRYQNKSLVIRSWIDAVELVIADISSIRIKVNDQNLPLIKTYSSVEPGMCAGLIGSTGLLEIVANQASAKSLLGLKKGNAVSLLWD